MDRDFKGVWIPKEVWFDKRLNALEKVILAEIDSLDMSDSGCFAGNEYIAEFCQCSVTKVSTAISKLIEYGYLTVQSFDGRQRVLKSSLSKSERQAFKKCKADSQNMKVSPAYTSNNNISNNTSIICNGAKPQTTRSVFVPPTVEEVAEYCRERKNGIDAQYFVDFYEARGWLIGKNKMKDWKAAVRTWERNGAKRQAVSSQPEKPETEAERIQREQMEAYIEQCERRWK